MRLSTLTATCLCLAALSLPSGQARAEIAPELELGLGLVGLVGGSFLDQPSDRAQSPGSQVQLVYPGFAGAGGGGGLSAELRWRRYLGLEVDLLLSQDQGFAYIDLVRVEIGQTAWHIPVLLKGIYPGQWARPMGSLGFEIVQPVALQASTAPVLPASATRIGSQAGTYVMVVVGAGVEFSLPVKDVDLRVPLQLRGAFNPGTPASARDRATYTFRDNEPLVVDTVIFSSEWQYQLQATLGLSLYF